MPSQTDVALLKRALRLCAQGKTPAEASQALGGAVSKSTIYRALATKKKPKAPPLPTEAQIEVVDDVGALERLLAEVRARKNVLPSGSPRYGPLVTAEAQILGQLRKARPPRPESPDEVTRRLVDVREAAENRILAIVEERAAKLEADRADFAAWARSAFGEHGGAEAVRRLDAMLGGPP